MNAGIIHLEEESQVEKETDCKLGGIVITILKRALDPDYDSGTLGFRDLYKYDRQKMIFCVILKIPNEIEYFFMFIGPLRFLFHAFSILSMSFVHFSFGYFFLIDL